MSGDLNSQKHLKKGTSGKRIGIPATKGNMDLEHCNMVININETIFIIYSIFFNSYFTQKKL